MTFLLNGLLFILIGLQLRTIVKSLSVESFGLIYEILILTFAVILVTLAMQGVSLPRLLRWLNFPADGAEREEEQRARETIAAVALQFLASTTKEDETHRRAVRHLQDSYWNRAERLDLADEACQDNPETTYLNQIDSSGPQLDKNVFSGAMRVRMTTS